MRGMLVLEDGTRFFGELFGAVGDAIGEVVFSTGMTGYEEVITDPSYHGQVAVLTYPLIGNYGINGCDGQSDRSHVSGLVVRDICTAPNHWRLSLSLADYCREQGVVGISGVDTRAVTRLLRERGTMGGVIAPADRDRDALREQAAAWTPPPLVASVTVSRPVTISGRGPHVVVVDLGVKRFIVDNLRRLGCQITIVPATYPASDILALVPQGVLLSNGPGDPKQLGPTITVLGRLLGRIPLFGICLGHQVLALALGADSYKLPYGHRGVNHPVRDLSDGRIHITSQNHGYAVDGRTLGGTGLVLTHVHLNDQTVEGLCHPELRAFSVQYHPEGGPGPFDTDHHFRRFVESLHRPASTGE